MKFSKKIQDELRSINLWHFVWISVCFAVFFAEIMSLILRGRLTFDYLLTSTVVSLIVASFVINLIKRSREIERQAKEILQKAHIELERQVEARTYELTKVNDQLQREIRYRNQVEAELKKSKEAAETANEAKSGFLTSMSHELRTPLNNIIGFTELIVDKKFGDLNETQEEYLNDVLHSSKHLLSLINDILDLSKVEAGKLELETTDVNVNTLLENSLAMIKDKAVKNNIKFSIDLEGITENINADERKLKQIMFNLLSNAAKFTPNGGSIRLMAKKVTSDDLQMLNIKQPEIQNLKLEVKDFVEISVTDTGIGLKSEDLERIFSPFEQIKKSASQKYQGTGLGLWLTKQLVELHGGRIWAKCDEKGKGTAFHFIIPLEVNHDKRDDSCN